MKSHVGHCVSFAETWISTRKQNCPKNNIQSKTKQNAKLETEHKMQLKNVLDIVDEMKRKTEIKSKWNMSYFSVSVTDRPRQNTKQTIASVFRLSTKIAWQNSNEKIIYFWRFWSFHNRPIDTPKSVNGKRVSVRGRCLCLQLPVRAIKNTQRNRKLFSRRGENISMSRSSAKRRDKEKKKTIAIVVALPKMSRHSTVVPLRSFIHSLFGRNGIQMKMKRNESKDGRKYSNSFRLLNSWISFGRLKLWLLLT